MLMWMSIARPVPQGQDGSLVGVVISELAGEDREEITEAGHRKLDELGVDYSGCEILCAKVEAGSYPVEYHDRLLGRDDLAVLNGNSYKRTISAVRQ